MNMLYLISTFILFLTYKSGELIYIMVDLAGVRPHTGCTLRGWEIAVGMQSGVSAPKGPRARCLRKQPAAPHAAATRDRSSSTRMHTHNNSGVSPTGGLHQVDALKNRVRA